MRLVIQPGSSSMPSGQTMQTTPALSSACTHFDLRAEASILPAVTSSRVSSGGCSAQSRKKAPPSLPGLPVGSRTSTSRRSANSDRLPDSALMLPQSKLPPAW